MLSKKRVSLRVVLLVTFVVIFVSLCAGSLKAADMKEGITLEGLKPEIVNILPVLDKIHREVVNRDTIITDAVSSRTVRSHHPSGYAIDIRIRDLTQEQAFNLYIEIQIKLGNCYDIVQEVDHIHIEYDPISGRCSPHDLDICRDRSDFGT